ncbi:MAG: hypothetical protein V4592_19630 [Bacteroidota bacterium]
MNTSGKLLLSAIAVIAFSCSQPKKTKTSETKDSIGKQIKADKTAYLVKNNDDAGRAKEWLLSNITRFLKENPLKDDTVMFTKQYLEYKHDAIGRDFDGLTNEQFIKKWKGKYDTKLVNSNSILLGQQDQVNPKITHFQLKNKNADNSFIFNVIIEDADTEDKYVHTRDVKVIAKGNTFVISDILEYDN